MGTFERDVLILDYQRPTPYVRTKQEPAKPPTQKRGADYKPGAIGAYHPHTRGQGLIAVCKSLGLPSNRPTASIRNYLRERDGDYCYLCGEVMDWSLADSRRKPHIEHVMPRAAGGRDEIDNFKLAHARCNSLKGRKW